MIIDDTLREGLQSPGISFTIEEKLELAKKISAAGVKEAIVSHPSAHYSEVEVTRRIVEGKYFDRVLGLGRAVPSDLDTAASAGGGIGTYIPFEPAAAERALDAVKYAVNRYGRGKSFIEVSITNVTAYSMDGLIKMAKKLMDIGVDRIQLADSLGNASPSFVARAVQGVKKSINIPVAVHFHNDVGAAVLNSITAIKQGADYVDTTIFGIGERNGIADLAVTCTILRMEGYRVEINMDALREAYDYLGKLIVEKAGVQHFRDNFPIFGSHVSTQTAGTHASYSEIFRENNYSLNVYVGKSMIKRIMRESGMDVSDEEASELVRRVKDLAVKTGRTINIKQLLDMLSEVRRSA
ncbi:MAG: hypothetical protein ACP5NY_05315 [Thermocladium sp.]